MIAESPFLWGFVCGQVVLLMTVVLLAKAFVFGSPVKRHEDEVKLRRHCRVERSVEEETGVVNALIARFFETMMLERMLRKWTKRLNQELARLPELRPWGRVQLTAIDLSNEPPRVQSMERRPDGSFRTSFAVPTGYSMTVRGEICPYKLLSLPFECDVSLQCVTVAVDVSILESEIVLTVLANPLVDFAMQCRWGHRIQVCDDTRYIEGLVRTYLRRALCEPIRINVSPV